MEAAEASFGDTADTLAKALDLLADCQRAYLAEPFATLADPELPKRLDGEAVTGTGASSGGGSNEELLSGRPA